MDAFDAETILTELSQLESLLIDLGLSMPEREAVTAATETFKGRVLPILGMVSGLNDLKHTKRSAALISVRRT
ncbi:MAG: hypothetical protein VX107_05625 [Pseudomonadota bacterium]|nr:hypothetical protein [Pseudomonadota bacterium]